MGGRKQALDLQAGGQVFLELGVELRASVLDYRSR